jgi:hypothetical protein
MAWLSGADWNDLFLSVISVAEIWQGIILLPAGRKRRSLEASFDLIPDRFPGRILSVDFAVGVKYGEPQAKAGPLPAGHPHWRHRSRQPPHRDHAQRGRYWPHRRAYSRPLDLNLNSIERNYGFPE